MKRFVSLVMCFCLVCSIGGFFVSCEKDEPEVSTEITEAATEAFRQDTFPFIGMRTKKSHFSRKSLDIPVSSLKFKYHGSNNLESIEHLKKRLDEKKILTCKDLILYLQQHDFIEDLNLSISSYKCLVYAICDLVYGKKAKVVSNEIFSLQKDNKVKQEKQKRKKF